MKEKIRLLLEESAKRLKIDPSSFSLDYPENACYGDISSNIALTGAKATGTSPVLLANRIKEDLQAHCPEDDIASISVAGPGFINFSFRDSHFFRTILNGDFDRPIGKGGKKILVEHTDPNTFKPFHIGHLMANAIGESLSRLLSHYGEEVTPLCYPSDIGLHIAKAIWAIRRNEGVAPGEDAPLIERTAFLGKKYAEGTLAYEESPEVKVEIDALNKTIYEKSDADVLAWFEKGRKWSLEHFESLYGRLGTKFAEYIFESEMAPIGLRIVRDNVGRIFEESEGAVVFRGDNHGLHTRVFINSQGLPTYEAKEIGLNTTKFRKYPDTDLSIVVTANEQNDYFRVLVKTLELLDGNIGARTKHIGHGMLRLPSGKMSSRTGRVITAEDLISTIKSMVMEKMKETDRMKEVSNEEKDRIADQVAIGAVKYTILRQSIGSDVIFDSVKSISFEGDSGPYLQYSAVRAKAVLEKAAKEGIEAGSDIPLPKLSTSLEKFLVRFPDIAIRAREEFAPQIVANYLVALAAEFNSFYARQVIVDPKDPLSPYYVVLTRSFLSVMTRGLNLLGIEVPAKM